MSELETYTLRKPIEVTPDEDGFFQMPTFNAESFHDVFVRVSEQNQQLRDILSAFLPPKEGYSRELDDAIDKQLDAIVDQVLAVVGLSKEDE